MSLFLQVKNERYSRFTLQPTEDGERHAEINLCEDGTEADDQAGGSPSFRPAPLHQNRLQLCFFVLGLLLIFAFGRIIVGMKNVACVQLSSNLEGNTCTQTQQDVLSLLFLVLQAASLVLSAKVEPRRCWRTAKVIWDLG